MFTPIRNGGPFRVKAIFGYSFVTKNPVGKWQICMQFRGLELRSRIAGERSLRGRVDVALFSVPQDILTRSGHMFLRSCEVMASLSSNS